MARVSDEDYCGVIFGLILVLAFCGFIWWVTAYTAARDANYATILMSKDEATIDIHKSKLINIPVSLLKDITITALEGDMVTLTGPPRTIASVFKNYLR